MKKAFLLVITLLVLTTLSTAAIGQDTKRIQEAAREQAATLKVAIKDKHGLDSVANVLLVDGVLRSTVDATAWAQVVVLYQNQKIIELLEKLVDQKKGR